MSTYARIARTLGFDGAVGVHGIPAVARREQLELIRWTSDHGPRLWRLTLAEVGASGIRWARTSAERFALARNTGVAGLACGLAHNRIDARPLAGGWVTGRATVGHAVGMSLNKIIQSAMEKYALNSIVITGGVAANKYIRSIIQDNFNTYNPNIIYFPDIRYCTDNAIGIAYLGSKIWRNANES